MNFSAKISSLIFLVIIICNKFSNEETIPMFCDTPKIDGIFNFGYEYRLRYDKWIWNYDFNKLSMIEPPMEESIFTGNSDNKYLRVLTTLFISSVPNCMVGMNEMECDKQRKAFKLLLTRFLDTNKNIEFTNVVRVKGTTLQSVSPEEYPWNLGSNVDFWPQEWNKDTNNTRPSAYSMTQFQAYFIVHSGNNDSSELLYNRILTNDWYNFWERVKIKSDVKFVGMFFYHIDGFVYAVGDRAHKGDPVSRMYRLEKSSSDGLFYLNKTNEEVRSFFKCKNMVTITTGENQSEEHVDNQKNSIAFIGIAGIAFILVIFSIVFTIVFVVNRGRRSAGQTYRTSSTNSGKPSLRS